LREERGSVFDPAAAVLRFAWPATARFGPRLRAVLDGAGAKSRAGKAGGFELVVIGAAAS